MLFSPPFKILSSKIKLLIFIFIYLKNSNEYIKLISFAMSIDDIL